jgi:hypothetical protein
LNKHQQQQRYQSYRCEGRSNLSEFQRPTERTCAKTLKMLAKKYHQAIKRLGYIFETSI